MPKQYVKIIKKLAKDKGLTVNQFFKVIVSQILDIAINNGDVPIHTLGIGWYCPHCGKTIAEYVSSKTRKRLVKIYTKTIVPAKYFLDGTIICVCECGRIVHGISGRGEHENDIIVDIIDIVDK